MAAKQIICGPDERHPGNMSAVAPLFTLCAILLSSLASCLRHGATLDVSPPDLRACTRIEIHYNAFAGWTDFILAHSDALNSEEVKYVNSLKTWIVNDVKLIEDFARSVRQGAYSGRAPSESVTPGGADVICYRDNTRLTSFTVHPELVVAEDGRKFKYPEGLPDLDVLDPPEIQPFRLRAWCAMHLKELFAQGLKHQPADLLVYPDPNRWCDVVVETLRTRYLGYAPPPGHKGQVLPDAVIARMFTCPSACGSASGNDAHPESSDAGSPNGSVRTWRSDYALNPNCGKNSPRDAVLLFETKAGWNQHGGPELFTFDNHDPRGGLVLLNDGTVKFIRTQEELKQLRWK